jgi:hypothetical protein
MTEMVLWCAIALILYAYIGYPCALALLSTVRNRPVRKTAATPPVSYIITVHNEESRIAAKLQNALTQDYPGELEIIVASDCSTDRTDDIVRGFAPHVRLVRAAERHGKEAAQHLAIAASSGRILVFSDAATFLDCTGISTLVANFGDPTVGCVSSIDRVIEADGTVGGEGAYVRYEMLLRRLESRVNSLVGLSGSLFAARREVCARWVSDRQSDFSTVLNSMALGLRGVIDPDAAGYYTNLRDGRRELERKIRTVVRGIAVLSSNLQLLNLLRHPLFAWQLTSHKICRWLVPFAMLAALVSGALLVARGAPAVEGSGRLDPYVLLLGLQLGFYMAATVGLVTGSRALRLPAYFVVVNFAILAAWMRYAYGERMTTWTPSERLQTVPRS